MLGLFGFFYHDDKPGPGIEKDAPTQKGLCLFLIIYRREYWNLVKLNGLFLLFCIPVFTIGPAIAGIGLIPFLFPAIAPLLLLVYFSNMSFIISFVTWQDIKKYIAAPSMTA